MLIRIQRRMRFVVCIKEDVDNTMAAEIDEMSALLGSGGVDVKDIDDEDSKDGKKSKKSDEESIEDEEEEIEEDEEEPEDEEELDEEEESDNEDEKEDEEEDKSKQSDKIEKLESKISSLLSIVEKLINKEDKKEDKKSKKEEVIDPFETNEFKDFTKELEYNEGEVKAFKKFLTFYGEQIHNNAVNKIMEVTPEVISKTMNVQTKQEKMSLDFYTQNPELSKVKKYVAQTAKEIKADNQDLSMEEVLAKTAKTVYKELGIKKGKQKKESKSGKDKKPAFAKYKGTRKKKGKKKPGIQNEIDEMNELLD